MIVCKIIIIFASSKIIRVCQFADKVVLAQLFKYKEIIDNIMTDMRKSKVGLDFEKVEHARGVAKKIAGQVQDFVEGYTTVAVERTICRLLGIDGIDENEVPLPNVVVDELKSKGVLGQGVCFFWATPSSKLARPLRRLPKPSLLANWTSHKCLSTNPRK